MDRELYQIWKQYVNMTPTQLEQYLKSYWGKQAGIDRKTARQMSRSDTPLKRGRDSARAIIRMKKKGVKNWTKTDWEWARRQVSFIARTLGQRNAYFKRNKYGDLIPTRTLLNLMIWGHNPIK